MNCDKYLHICRGQCCGCCPIPKDVYYRNLDKIIQEPLSVFEVPAVKEVVSVVPHTANRLCVFLNKEHRCNIYEERGFVCRKYGDESHVLLTCAFQRKDGSERSKRESERIAKKQRKYILKNLNKLRNYDNKIKEMNGFKNDKS